MTSRLRWMVPCAIATPLAIAITACPGADRIGVKPAALLTVRQIVDPCLTVVGQTSVSPVLYELSRAEAVHEANAVRDSIGQAASQPAARLRVPNRAANVVKKPSRPPLMTVWTQQPVAPGSVQKLHPQQPLLGSDSLHNIGGPLKGAIIRTLSNGSNATNCGSIAMPEVQDAQRIINADGSFGPIVQLISIDSGMVLNAPTDFDTGYVAVAMAGVTPDTAPENKWYPLSTGYKRLNLDFGVSCIYLRHSNVSPAPVVAERGDAARGGTARQAGSATVAPIDRAKAAVSAKVEHSLVGPGTWTAVIAPLGADSLCNTSSASNAAPMDVVRYGDSPTDSIPRAARFIEGKDMMSFIAVKCANAWCVVGPNPNATLQAPAHAGALSDTAGPKKGRRTDDALWFDEQHLAIPDAKNKLKLVPGFLASIVPDTGLQNKARDYKDKWYPMAYLYAPSEPLQKYQDGFGLRKGWNEIRMRQINGIWFAMIVSADGSTHVRDIDPFEHTFGDIPGTVRFDWVSGDDWVWIPCSDGCCLVQDGRDS